jgi:hypothetical protein
VQNADKSLAVHLGQLLPHLIEQIERLSAKYSALLAKFICQLIQIQTNELKGRDLIFNAKVVEQFRKIMGKEKNSINFFRVFEIILRLAAVSPAITTECNMSFGLNTLIKATIDSDDILSKLNCIELLIDLGLTSHGYHYLTDLGVLGNLANSFDSKLIESDPFMQLILPGLVMKWFLITLSFS